MGHAARRARHEILAAAHAWLAHHCGVRPDGRQLHPDRAVFRRAARLDLHARAHGGRQIRAGCDEAMTTAPRLDDTTWLTQGPLARLLAVLDRDGEEARVVGGAVRNVLLGHAPGDIDVATTALPEEVTRRAAAAGFRPVPTGVEHGTVTVVVDGTGFEVTTLREDVETFGRKARVRFGRSWQKAAARRDFTFNALSVSRDGTVHDPVGGIEDLKQHRVRFIGDPAMRIGEGYLRIR